MATRKDSTDAQMLFVGSACSHPTCNQHDFLPIRCDLCAATFCTDHFRPAEHQCAKFDPLKADRIAPSCPLCSTPVSIPPSQDPNVRMDAHIMNDCQVMGTKRTNAPQARRCAGAKCNKVLIAPIRCNSCRKEFCPEHRFPQQHSCASYSTSSIPKPSPSPVPQATSSRLADKLSNISLAGSRPGQPSPSAAAAIAAINHATARTKPAPSPAAASQPKPAVAQSTGGSSSKHSVPNPFNKTDRCDPTLPSSANADVVPAMDIDQPPHKRPVPIDTSFRPPPIFGFA